MSIDLNNIIKCPNCSKDLLINEKQIICKFCKEKYPIIFGIPVLITKKECIRLGLSYHSDNIEHKIFESNIFKKNDFGIMNLKEILVYTNGILYEKVKEPKSYPIAKIPFEKTSNNEFFIDIGCGWGRWTVNAAQKGYNTVGIDLNLSWLIFAKKMSNQLGINNCSFICCDVLNLPIKSNIFDKVYSFSFLQHFSEGNLKRILRQVFEIMKKEGIFKTLMVNKYSLRGIYNDYMIKNSRSTMLEKGRIEMKEDESNFNVRYFSLIKINKLFKTLFKIKNSEIYCFFTQAQKVDLDILYIKPKLLFKFSLLITFLLSFIPFAKYLSDNLIYTLKK